jgi:hypothetical protein
MGIPQLQSAERGSRQTKNQDVALFKASSTTVSLSEYTKQEAEGKADPNANKLQP